MFDDFSYTEYCNSSKLHVITQSGFVGKFRKKDFVVKREITREREREIIRKIKVTKRNY